MKIENGLVKIPQGLPFKVVGTSTVHGVAPGGTVVLDDPHHAWLLVMSGAVQAKGLSKGDEMILLEFARAGLKFDPDEWAPEPVKPKKGAR